MPNVQRSSWQKLTRWVRNIAAPPHQTAPLEVRGPSMASKQGVALATGVLLFISGLFLALSWDYILETQVNKEFLLTERSATYEPWRKSKVEVYIKFYFWNWTNPHEFRVPGTKPKLVECGPYSYREVAEKTNIIWNRNGTVTYNRIRHWYFDPQESNGTEDDVITSLNVVAKSAAFITRNDNYFKRQSLGMMITGTQKLYTEKPIRELLFEGYHNNLIDTANTFSALAGMKVPFDKFGWFYKRNGSVEADGVFNIETGANGMDHFGMIRSWNYQNHTPYYEDECGEVRGSGGEFFPPKRTKKDIVELFSPDLCRFVSFHYAKEEEVAGIKGFRYETKSSLLDNGEEDPRNHCFCSGDCAPPGALNVSACRLGAPAFVSFPHFYMADSVYRNAVEGMNPDPAKHGGHITMEPNYAVTLDVAARFQINILVQNYSDITLFAGLPQMYFPIMWFEQTAKIPQDTAATVRTLLLMPTVGMSVAAILILSGVALVSYVVAVRILKPSKKLPINDHNRKTIEPMMPNGFIKRESEKEISKWDTNL